MAAVAPVTSIIFVDNTNQPMRNTNRLVAFVAWGALVTIGVILMVQVSGVNDKNKSGGGGGSGGGQEETTIYTVKATAQNEADYWNCMDVCAGNDQSPYFPPLESPCCVAARIPNPDGGHPFANECFGEVEKGYLCYCTTNVNFCEILGP